VGTAATTRKEIGNLPLELTSFVDREEQLTEASGQLATSRLVTLIGMGSGVRRNKEKEFVNRQALRHIAPFCLLPSALTASPASRPSVPCTESTAAAADPAPR